jgi:zinc protease
MQKFFLILLGFVVLNWNGIAQEFTDLSQPIPPDSTIRTGVLNNGLTYFIKHNEEPEERASFYIYQNVGAILENDDQDGLAHFLEHMAFNGTTTFPGKSMLDMLERNGVKFGADINAYTAKDETVYNISRVPTTNIELLDSCLLILRDWSDRLALTEEEIDAERGVITEEWRTRQNSNFRIRAQMAPAIYNGSKYAERDVIGELDVIKNFKPEVLRSFYYDWYRTDLQAIAIVGDIDAAEMEKKVIALFSAIPAVENPKPRYAIEIPDNMDPIYNVATDHEVKNVSLSLYVRHAYRPENTLESRRENYVHSLFNTMMRNRFAEISQSGDAPFLSASIQLKDFVRGYKIFQLISSSHPGEEVTAFQTVYTVLQQVINEGFTENELERAKKNMLSSSENAYNKRDQISSDTYCKSLKDVYLTGVSLPDAEFKHKFEREIIPGITLKEVSAVPNKYLTDENRVYSVIGPEGSDSTIITLDEIENTIADVESSDLEAYIDNTPINTELLPEKPQPGKIVSEKSLDQFDATEWTLSNGAKVVFRFANFQKDIVQLRATSEGGSSVYEASDLPSLTAVNSFVRSFGIGSFDPVTYNKVMVGKRTRSAFKVETNYETISADAIPDEIETMLQLVYMRFEDPRFDEEKYNNLMERNYRNLENKVITANSIIRDTLNSIINQGNPRSRKWDKSLLDEMSFDRMKSIYHERFSNAADFVFFIVGDINEEKLKPLVEKYIGAIGTTGEKENWVDNGIFFPEGKNTYRIAVPEENKSKVYLRMSADTRYSRETVVYQTILQAVLKLRFTENIREKEGGTYGVYVASSVVKIPEPHINMEIKFDCAPQNADRLKSLVYGELENVQHHVLQTDLDKVVLSLKKNREHAAENNNYWMSVLQTYYESGENMLDPEYYDAILDRVTTKDIEKQARTFFKHADVVDIIFESEDINL